MVQLRKLIKKGVVIEDLWEFGFEGEEEFDGDGDDGEFYFKLYLNGEYVGDTEINNVNGDIEIVCYDKVSHDKVIAIVGEAVTVWAWYDNIATNNN